MVYTNQGFHQRRSEIAVRAIIKFTAAYNLVRIENRNRRWNHQHDGIEVEESEHFHFLLF